MYFALNGNGSRALKMNMMNGQKLIPLSEFQTVYFKANLPFASYRLPGHKVPKTITGPKHLMEYRRIGEILPRGNGFLMAPYAGDEPLLFLPANNIIEGFEVNAELIRNILPENFSLDDPDLRSIERPEYLKMVKQAIVQIQSGEAGKIVLSRPIKRFLPDAPLFAGKIFELLCSSHPAAFVYLVNIPGKGLWMGASPEILLMSGKGAISTMSLSGTRKKGASDVEWGQKEIDEHLWVSRFISQSLADAGCSNLTVSPIHTSGAGNVEHLTTTFAATCTLEMMPSLIEMLHPTPAVCGWPTPAAKQLIREIENYDRSLYTGYLGPVNSSGDFGLFVNLRCMHLTKNLAVVYVGGGITIDSDPETEWEETELKSRTMLGAIEKIANFAG